MAMEYLLQKEAKKKHVKDRNNLFYELLGISDLYRLITGKEIGSSKKAARIEAVFWLASTVVPVGKSAKLVFKGLKGTRKGSKVTKLLRKL